MFKLNMDESLNAVYGADNVIHLIMHLVIVNVNCKQLSLALITQISADDRQLINIHFSFSYLTSHRCLCDNIQRRKRHQRIHVHHFTAARKRSQFGGQHLRFVPKDLAKTLENPEMKCWRDDLAMFAPPLATGRQQTGAQPRFEEGVRPRFAVVLRTRAEHDFHVFGARDVNVRLNRAQPGARQSRKLFELALHDARHFGAMFTAHHVGGADERVTSRTRNRVDRPLVALKTRPSSGDGAATAPQFEEGDDEGQHGGQPDDEHVVSYGF